MLTELGPGCVAFALILSFTPVGLRIYNKAVTH